MLDVGVHDAADGAASKEEYVRKSAKFGIRSDHKHAGRARSPSGQDHPVGGDDRIVSRCRRLPTRAAAAPPADSASCPYTVVRCFEYLPYRMNTIDSLAWSGTTSS